jgi:hypothetical protein
MMRGMNREPNSLLEDPSFVETTNDLLKALENAAPVVDDKVSDKSAKASKPQSGYNPYDVGSGKHRPPSKPKRQTS